MGNEKPHFCLTTGRSLQFRALRCSEFILHIYHEFLDLPPLATLTAHDVEKHLVPTYIKTVTSQTSKRASNVRIYSRRQMFLSALKKHLHWEMVTATAQTRGRSRELKLIS